LGKIRPNNSIRENFLQKKIHKKASTEEKKYINAIRGFKEAGEFWWTSAK